MSRSVTTLLVILSLCPAIPLLGQNNVATVAASMPEGTWQPVTQNATITDALTCTPMQGCGHGIGNLLGDSSQFGYDPSRLRVHGTGSTHGGFPTYFYLDLATNNWTNTCPIIGDGHLCTTDGLPRFPLGTITVNSGTSTGPNHTFTNVPFDSTTTQVGQAATFDVTVVNSGHTYTAVINNPGYEWNAFDNPTTITIKGSRLGGADGVNDLVLNNTTPASTYPNANNIFSHGYSLLTTNPVTGTSYYHGSSANDEPIWNLPIGGTWGTTYTQIGPNVFEGTTWWSGLLKSPLTNPTASAVPHGGAMIENRGYFDAFGNPGYVTVFQPDSVLASNIPYPTANPASVGNYPAVAVYDEKLNAMFFGGGGSERKKVWRMNFNQTSNVDYTAATLLCDAPIPDLTASPFGPGYYSAQGEGSWHMYDEPGVGRLLLIGNPDTTDNGHTTAWELDPDGVGSGCMGTYTLLGNQPPSALGSPSSFNGSALAGVALPNYGVILFASCVTTACNVYLYKPVGNFETFSQQCAHSGVIRCNGLSTSGEMRHVYTGSGTGYPIQPYGRIPVNGCQPVCYYDNLSLDPTVTVNGDSTLKMTTLGTNSPPGPIITTAFAGTPSSLVGAPTSLSNLVGGSGYTTGSNVAVTGGTGTGLHVDIVASGGVITSAVIHSGSAGTGYTMTNVVTIAGGTGGTVTIPTVDTVVTFTDITADTTSCSGTGATFTVIHSGGYPAQYFAGLSSSAGTGYVLGCTLTFLGTSLGGASPANDLTATVTQGPDIGAYGINFCDTFSGGGPNCSFGENSEFWIQYRLRLSPTMVSNHWAGGEGFKIMAHVIGDPDNMTSKPTCTSIDLPVQEYFYAGITQAYQSCTGSQSHGPYSPFQDQFPYNCLLTGVSCTDLAIQDATPDPYCLYSKVTIGNNTGCFEFPTNEWFTVKTHSKLGPRGSGGLVSTFTWSGTAPSGSGSASNVGQDSIVGSGTGVKFDISWSGGVFTSVVIHDLNTTTGTRGSGYLNNGSSTVTILGSHFTSGVDGTNNLTIPITHVLYNVVGAPPLDEFVNSYFELWLGHDGQHLQSVIKWGPWSWTAGIPALNETIGKAWFSTYVTNRSDATLPEADAWYSHVVISTANIADPVASDFVSPSSFTLDMQAPGNVNTSSSLPLTVRIGNSGGATSGTSGTVKIQLASGVVANSWTAGADIGSMSCSPLSVAGALVTCPLTLSIGLAPSTTNGTAQFTLNTTSPGIAGTIIDYDSIDSTGGSSPPTPGPSCLSSNCGNATTVITAPSVVGRGGILGLKRPQL